MKQEEKTNREKNYIVPKGAQFLFELGVSNKNGDIRPPMYKKYRQICRFSELFVERIKSTKAVKQKRVKVVDIGSGSGYLTFAVFYCLSKLGLDPVVFGIERRQELVKKCNDIAERCGYSNLHFVCTEADQFDNGYFDAVIALHACDTATDDALAYGIKQKSKVILSAPCCQKEILKQMRKKKNEAPNLAFFDHGLFLTKHADMITDMARVLLLESQGYSVDVIDFVASEHTQKNTLIAATLRKPKSQKSLEKYILLKNKHGFENMKLEAKLEESGVI